MMFDYGMGWGFGWMGMILFWLILLLLVFALIKYVASKPTISHDAHKANGKIAMEYLDEAYAKGELSREEFLQKREDLKRG